MATSVSRGRNERNFTGVVQQPDPENPVLDAKRYYSLHGRVALL